MKWTIMLLASAMVCCVQSTAIVDPVTNKAYSASTAATQGAVTLSLNLTSQGAFHEGQPFSALLFQNGVLKAAQYNNGGTNGTDRTGTTAGSNAGKATLKLKAVDGNNCVTGTTATLPNGTYYLYFGIQYAGETVGTVNTGTAGATCSASNGHIHYLTNVVAPTSLTSHLYSYRGSVIINGDTTISIGNSQIMNAYKYTFQFATGGAWNYTCYITDANTTAYSTSAQLITYYTLSLAGDGSTTGIGAQTNLMAAGIYKYFCYADTNTNGNFFQSGIDKIATGTLNVTGDANGAVTGYGTTYLTAGSFSTLP